MQVGFYIHTSNEFLIQPLSSPKTSWLTINAVRISEDKMLNERESIVVDDWVRLYKIKKYDYSYQIKSDYITAFMIVE